MRVKSFVHVVEYLNSKNIPYVLDDYTNPTKIAINTLRMVIHSYDNVFDAFHILENKKQIWGVINNRRILLFHMEISETETKPKAIYMKDIVNELGKEDIRTIIKHGISFPLNYILTLEDHYNAIFDYYQINYNKNKVVGYIKGNKITLFKF